MTTDELIDAVIDWGRAKGLDNAVMQYAKMNEEVGEIAHELTRGNLKTTEMKDALGDTAVTLIILADILGFDIVRCLELAYDEIKNRKGQTKGGSFVKEEDGEN